MTSGFSLRIFVSAALKSIVLSLTYSRATTRRFIWTITSFTQSASPWPKAERSSMIATRWACRVLTDDSKRRSIATQRVGSARRTGADLRYAGRLIYVRCCNATTGVEVPNDTSDGHVGKTLCNLACDPWVSLVI